MSLYYDGYRYLYGADGLLEAETTARRSTLAKVYIYWQGRPVGLVQNNALYFIQSDHLNRPFAVTDANNRTVWAAKNTAFDRVVTTNSIGDLNIGFPGQYYDRETQLWYNWYRYYDASTGRYLQSDPIGLSGGLNTYTYVGGNPVSLVDPMGLCAQEERSFWDNLGRHLPSVPQGSMDFAGGLGDAILFGFGDDIRSGLNIDGGINTDSQLYSVGEISSIAAGGVGIYRGLYVGSFKLAGMSRNMTVLNSTSAVRNAFKRFGGPALFNAAERAKIVPFATHVANKGFDAARAGLGRTRDTYNSLIGLSPGIGGVFND